jgi:hypothetical protein
MTRTILVDFDGVLHMYTSEWQGHAVIPDGPVPFAMEWLVTMANDKRFTTCVYSSRSKEQAGIEAMKAWLLKYGMMPETLEKIQFPTEKPGAFLTIDDRAFCFQGSFPDPDEILAFKPWNKR